MTLVRASRRFLLVRFGDQWFRYESWFELFRDLKPGEKLWIQAVKL